jgi:hypothetical protein
MRQKPRQTSCMGLEMFSCLLKVEGGFGVVFFVLPPEPSFFQPDPYQNRVRETLNLSKS